MAGAGVALCGTALNDACQIFHHLQLSGHVSVDPMMSVQAMERERERKKNREKDSRGRKVNCEKGGREKCVERRKE